MSVGAQRTRCSWKQKEKMDNGDEMEALEMFGNCIIDHGHYVALEHFAGTVMGKRPLNGDLVALLLDIIVDGMDSIWQGEYANKCQLFEVVDLEKLIDILGKVYEKSLDIYAVRYLCRALVLQSQETGDINERCIEAFEFLLLSSNVHDLEIGHFFLGLCYFRNYCSTGRQLDRKIGIEHFTSASKYRHTFSIGFLLEKGTLSGREYERVGFLSYLGEISPFWPNQLDLKKYLHDIFMRSSNFEYRMPRSEKAAFAIYSDIFQDISCISTNSYFGPEEENLFCFESCRRIC